MKVVQNFDQEATQLIYLRLIILIELLRSNFIYLKAISYQRFLYFRWTGSFLHNLSLTEFPWVSLVSELHPFVVNKEDFIIFTIVDQDWL